VALALRRRSGLTRRKVAYGSLISQGHTGALAYAKRRTRRSTLARIVDVLVAAQPSLGPADQLLEHLCEVARPALALAFAYPEHAARKWRRRAARRKRGTWTV
jgi:hypothetical protein